MVEPKMQVSDLLNYLKDSPLVGMYNLNLSEPPPETLTSKDMQSICKGLEQLLLDDLTYDKLAALFVASSRTYLMSNNFTDFEYRSELLHKTFRYSNTLDPVNLHDAAKRMHQNLKTSPKLLLLCNNICLSSDLGNSISMCLLWAMLLEILGKNIEMYCFHPFSLINELLVDVDVNEMIKGNQDTSEKAHFILQLIAALVRSITSSPNEAFIKAGYSQYFRYEIADLTTLHDWATAINDRTNVCIDNSSNTNYDQIILIKETIAYSIISPLGDKLHTINGDCDNVEHV